MITIRLSSHSFHYQGEEFTQQRPTKLIWNPKLNTGVVLHGGCRLRELWDVAPLETIYPISPVSLLVLNLQQATRVDNKTYESHPLSSTYERRMLYSYLFNLQTSVYTTVLPQEDFHATAQWLESEGSEAWMSCIILENSHLEEILQHVIKKSRVVSAG